MTIRRSRSLRGEDGQAMTEFAVIVPIFLLLVLGIAQLGIAFNHHTQLTDAARAGARYGAPLGCSGTCDRTTLVVSKVKASASNLDQAKLGITVTSTWQKGTDLRVCATYPYAINLIGLVVKSGSLSSCSTARIE